jgi:hypothetical protein
MVPPLYVAIAFFSESVLRLARDAYVRRDWLRLISPVVIAFIAFRLCSDIVSHGVRDLRARSLSSNHQLDDRAGVHWLTRHRQPGDVVMTTHLALPAVWWYGQIPAFEQGFAASRPPAGGGALLEVGYRAPGPDCERNQFRSALKDARRVLVYFGFRFDDVPGGFDALLLDTLGDIGVMVAYQRFAESGHAAVFELPFGPAGEQIISNRRQTAPAGTRPRLEGCTVVTVASRW